jgi:hypothetical protein
MRSAAVVMTMSSITGVDRWLVRLRGLRLRDLHRALAAADVRRAAALAALAGCPHHRHGQRARLARRLLLAIPGLDHEEARVVAILLTAPVHDELVAAARTGRLRRDQGAVLGELLDRWSPALLALELALVTDPPRPDR